MTVLNMNDYRNDEPVNDLPENEITFELGGKYIYEVDDKRFLLMLVDLGYAVGFVDFSVGTEVKSEPKQPLSDPSKLIQDIVNSMQGEFVARVDVGFM